MNLVDYNKINIWIIEDNVAFRNSIAAVINANEGMKCTNVFSSCEDALHELKKDDYPPEIFLLDIGLPGMSGIEGIKKLKAITPSSFIIIITVFDDDYNVFNAICNGASGYLLKSAPSEKIIEGIQEVLHGGAPMNSQIARKVMEMLSHHSVQKGDYGLTIREKEILQLLVDGKTKKQISQLLFISYFTVDTHLKNIYNKLQVHSKGGALSKVYKEDLLK